MRDLNEIQCFVKAIELKSLTAAAKALNLPKSSMSRKIRNLETRLGMTLVTRTTRALHLTDAGRTFFEKSALALKELNTAEEALDGSREAIQGTLRISAPVEFSSGPFNDLVAAFLQAHPLVNIELVMTDRVVDLIGEGFDCAFRIGELKDSTLIAKKLRTYQAQIVASPEYLKARGTPKTIADFEKHDCISFAPLGSPMKWSLKGPNGKKEFTPKGRLQVNHLFSLKESALKGMGLALIPKYMMSKELENKTLKAVCPDWQAYSYPVHIVYPGQKFLSPKMRAFVDHASERLCYFAEKHRLNEK